MTSTKRAYRQRKKELNPEKPTLWIGKNGIASDLVEEANRQLQDKEVVKIRVHRIVTLSVKEVADIMASKTESTVIEVKGRTLVIYKPNRGEDKKQTSTEEKS
jgi:RNA-binding protein